MRVVCTPQSRCRVGIARCDITPPVGIYHRMWGAATHERATGVHRPLSATALVLRSPAGGGEPDAEHAILALDHCLLWAREMQELLTAVAAATGLAPAQITTAFSHTHAAGLMGREREALPGGELIPAYLQSLAENCARIVRAARDAAAPATIVYGAGRCPLAAHRDYWDEVTGQWVCGFNPGGPADDTVLVGRVAADDGRLLATVVNYACHPTTLAWENTLISPDYPGAMRETVEAATSAPCIFLQGASGDLGPREGYVGDPAVADRNGRQLGHAALAALEALPPPATQFAYAGPVVSGATLGDWRHVPLDKEAQDQSAAWSIRRFTVELPKRPGLAGPDDTLRERADWQSRLDAALAAGDAAAARDARALVERLDRRLVRIADLPLGASFPLPVTVLRSGGACWVAVEGEPYNVLQRTLRERFPRVPIVVVALANGSRPAYLPPADCYDRGIYQESIAVLAAGSLERLIDEIGRQVAAALDSTER
jgi:hypothetical protein